MPAGQKACKKCKSLVDGGNKCPKCGSDEIAENSKGIVKIMDSEKSEVAKSLKIKDKGAYAIKLG
jgi:RNA polymerase subunit RPABC4/transcription elongation factor Spt4